MSAKTETENKILVPHDLSPGSERDYFARLDDILSRKIDRISLDCALLQRVTSSHINILWQTYCRCNETGIIVDFSGVSVNLKRVLVMLDLYDLLIAKPIGFTELTGHDMPIRRKNIGKELKLEFAGEKEDIDYAIDSLRQFLKMLKLPEFTAFEIETIFYEVVTNIRLHGHIPEGSIIKATVTITEDGIRMRFIDRGVPFDPTKQTKTFDPNLAAGRRQKRGYGMVMISRMTDKIYYERQDDCLNVLTLEKNGGK
ncbi:MAG: ATP-binding protein [Candidatus Zixiibacteriota bacterium]